mgnify:FL=1
MANKSEPKVKVFRDNGILKAVIISAVLVLIVLCVLKNTSGSFCNSAPPVSSVPKKVELNICSGVEDIYVASGNEKSIRLYRCWSGVIGTEQDKHRIVTADGDFERCIWDRERERCSAITSGNNHHYREYGMIDTNLFRLRSLQDGENCATIAVK